MLRPDGGDPGVEYVCTMGVSSILGQFHSVGLVMLKECLMAGRQVAPSWLIVCWTQREEAEMLE